MPRGQVYGKRSRAIYDPLESFGSPQRAPGDNIQATDVPKATERPPTLKSRNASIPKSRVATRKALGEKSVNEVLQTIIPIRDGSRKPQQRQRPRRIVVVEDNDEEQEEVKAKVLITTKVGESKSQDGSQPANMDEQAPENEYQEIDDVPFFCDIDGYDSEGDGQEGVYTQAEKFLRRRSKSEPPAVTISPPTPPTLDEYSEHCAELLKLSSHPMNAFSEWANLLSSHFSIVKIAEASFGEVYRLSLLEQLPGFSSSDESVFKIIALQPPGSTLPTEKRKRGATAKKIEGMSKPDDVANEVKLLQRMSSIPGFTNFRDVRIIQGRPPQPFVKAFKNFNVSQKAKKKELSLFPDPAKKASYSEDQLWAVIEMQDAGTDLECLVENGSCVSVFFVWDAFWQVVLSLAKGEEGAEFEHRDLHLGNICVRQASDQNMDVDVARKLKFTNLETTIIDYTISRAAMSDGLIAYQDLARDSGLFEGDSTEEYQYDIYRYMRGALFLDDPYAEFSKRLENSERTWEQYHPVTNLIWLHFILYKLLEQVNWPSSTKAPPRKQKAQHAEWKRANDLEHILLRVQELLYPDVIYDHAIGSASGLVGLALTEGWIDVEDVVGEGVESVEDNDENALVDRFAGLELQTQPRLHLQQESETVSEPAAKAKTRRRRP